MNYELRIKNYKFLSIILLIGMFTTMPAFAQKDVKAKEILDKTSAMLNQSGGLSVDFTLNINDEINKLKQSFEGKIDVKGEKFYLETPDQAVYFNGKTQWSYIKAVDEVTVLEPQPQEIRTLNPVSVFDLYKVDCDYKYKGEKTGAQKRKVQEISLFPKDKKEEIKQVDIQINPNDGMPVYFHVIYKNKQEFRIYVDKYQTKLNLPDSRFVFDKKKYPTAEINDLR